VPLLRAAHTVPLVGADPVCACEGIADTLGAVKRW